MEKSGIPNFTDNIRIRYKIIKKYYKSTVFDWS